MLINLGEKVVSEKEYLSAITLYDAVQGSSVQYQSLERRRRAVVGSVMDVSSELA